jgi:hypothetical protein
MELQRMEELHSLSPSLNPVRRGLGPAYETKFLLNEQQARQVEEVISGLLTPDPYGDPALGGAYAVTSLACDDPALSVFHQEGAINNRKYRVRRYGSSDSVFLERKQTRRGQVRKRRSPAPRAQLDQVMTGHCEAVQAWFVREVEKHEQAPVCRVAYLRRAFMGECGEGPMRVTFDRRLRGALVRGWSFEDGAEERHLCDGLVVCEFKFQGSMPGPLRTIVSEHRLEAKRFSKYRACVRVFAHGLGLAGNGTPMGDNGHA